MCWGWKDNMVTNTFWNSSSLGDYSSKEEKTFLNKFIRTVVFHWQRFPLKQFVGQTIHHIENSGQLAQEFISYEVDDNYTFDSHDVISLFTNTPIDALNIIRCRLEIDKYLKERTWLKLETLSNYLCLSPLQHISSSGETCTDKTLALQWEVESAPMCLICLWNGWSKRLFTQHP